MSTSMPVVESHSQSADSVKNKTSSTAIVNTVKDEDGTAPEFIYGGPFIMKKKDDPFLDTILPINLPQQGTFKRSFAYYSLKERMPVIITKVIDTVSRTNPAGDPQLFIAKLSKLKSDMMTNKPYEKFRGATREEELWNEWIDAASPRRYYTNTWCFTECYIYRKIREFGEIAGMGAFDPFEEQKTLAFQSALEPICVVASRLPAMLEPGERDRRKADFQLLLKVSMWANKCDLSLNDKAPKDLYSHCEKLPKPAPKKKGKSKTPAEPAPVPEPPPMFVDPFQFILDCKERIILDQSGKAFESITKKGDAVRKKIANFTGAKTQCSCHRLATLGAKPLCYEGDVPPVVELGKKKKKKEKKVPPPAEGVAPPEPEGPKPPCPAKLNVPHQVNFDIVCDNAGFELFADLCFAHFLIAHKMADKIRFHVKKYPWFVSDVTAKDFHALLDKCVSAKYRNELPPLPRPPPPPPPLNEDGSPGAPPPPETPPGPRVLTSDAVNTLGRTWQQFLKDGTFLVMDEDYWTYPHSYCDMKKYDYNMYRKLQYSVAVLYKGDLNYRKLLGDVRVVHPLKLEQCTQGYLPAAALVARTVKSEILCGMPKQKSKKKPYILNTLAEYNEQWMTTGEFGIIQFAAKTEPFKASLDKPCVDYCDQCLGVVCPEHTDF